MSLQDKKLTKNKPSSSLGEASLRQLAQPYANESGDENSVENMKTSVNNNVSEIKRSKTKKDNSQDLSMTLDSIKVDSDKITFISEKDFKNDKNCWVCKIMFGKINERQSHCRLCSHSVCKVCSGKRVNDNRVCDICFLKMKNVKGEKRKKKLLAAMKNFLKNLSINIHKGSDENKKLEAKNRHLKEQVKNEEENRQNELNLLKLKLEQIQSNKMKTEQKIKSQETALQKKKVERQDQQDKLNDVSIKIKNIMNDIMLNTEIQNSKQTQFKQLYNQKLELINQESFIRLPNYDRAKRNDPDNICEAIIFLDNNDQRNGINHYNTVSNNNMYESTIDSNTIEKQSYQNSLQNKNMQQNSRVDYASSYNQGVISENSDIIQHDSRPGKKQKSVPGKGTSTGSCLCE